MQLQKQYIHRGRITQILRMQLYNLEIQSTKTPQNSGGKKNQRKRTYCREGVAGVRNQQASFANGTITNRNTFYEPGRTHSYLSDLHPVATPPSNGSPLNAIPLQQLIITKTIQLSPSIHHEKTCNKIQRDQTRTFAK